ncbi:MAG: MMPL family transporter [Myxococcota bacterium]|nr:MMPL family transporter [Myxococcota bacterium]
MFGRLADSIAHARRPWSVAALLVVLVVSGGASSLRPDFALEHFFGSEDSAWDVLERYKAFWGPDDDVMIIVAHVDEGDVLSRERLEAIQELEASLEALEMVKEVTTVATVTRMQNQEDALVLSPVLETFPDASERDGSLGLWRDQLLGDELLVPGLLSADAKTTTIVVEFTESSADMEQVVPMVAAVRGVTEAFAGKHGLVFAEAGIPAVRADFFAQVMKDQAVFLPLGMLLMAGCLFWVFRSRHGVLIPGLAASVPLMMIFGVMGYRGGHIDMVNQTLTTVLPSIAVADAIHLLNRFHEEARKLAAPGEKLSLAQRHASIRAALAELGSACFLTSLTTGIGFASLATAQMPILRQFGLDAALGILFSYGSVLVIVPIMLSMTRGVVPEGPDSDAPQLMDRVLGASARLALARPWLMVAGAVLVIGVFGWFSRQVVVDNNLTGLLPDDHRTSVANSRVDSELAGILNYEFDITGQPGDLKRPDVLRAMEDYGAWVKTLPSIRHVTSPGTFVARSHELMGDERRVPESAAAVAQLLLLMEGHEELEKVVNMEYSRGRMVVRGQDHGANYFADIEAQMRAGIPTFFKDTGVDVQLTGTGVVAYRGINNVTVDLRDSLIFAFLVVTLLIGVVFRDVALTVLALVPNGLPLLVGYGAMGLGGFFLDPTAGLVFTVGFGIAVDDTIHLLSRFREELAAGKNRDSAILASVTQSGRAVAVTSVILMFGLGINVLSSFEPMYAMGMTGAIIMVAAFLCDVLVLPALLKIATPERTRVRESVGVLS